MDQMKWVGKLVKLIFGRKRSIQPYLKYHVIVFFAKDIEYNITTSLVMKIHFHLKMLIGALWRWKLVTCKLAVSPNWCLCSEIEYSHFWSSWGFQRLWRSHQGLNMQPISNSFKIRSPCYEHIPGRDSAIK